MTVLINDGDGIVDDTRLTDSFYSKYNVENVLGTGASSTVRLCTEKDSGLSFAVKILDLNSGVDVYDVIRSECMREVVVLRRLSGHPNIIQLHDVFEGDTYIFLVAELCQHGELFDYLSDNASISEKKTRGFMRQLFDALTFIHKHDIVHRDLKPENILLDENLNIKITDFGLAVFVDDETELRETRGTPGYLAPEVLKCGYYTDQPPYGQPVDLWACGVIMYTLLVGFPPFWNRKEHLMLRQIMEGRFNFPSPEWDDISESAKDLIRKLLVVDSSIRLTSTEALEHPFFLHQPVASPKIFEAGRKFRVIVGVIAFIFILKRMKMDAGYLNIGLLAKDPYANKKLRKFIDTWSYNIYSQWVKKGEEQNRAALFENAPRRDLINQSETDASANLLGFYMPNFKPTMFYPDLTSNAHLRDDDEEFNRPIRINY